MLYLTIAGDETWNEASEEFDTTGNTDLVLEHSLVSLSKWESFHEKPFLGGEEKTGEQIMSYIEMMILTPDFSPEVLLKLSQENIDEVDKYLNASRTATWFPTEAAGRSQEQITSELIYYWMIAFEIPFECQYWHLNRLFTLIRVCNVKNSKPKKRSHAEMVADRQRINAERQAKYNTKG